MLWKRKIRQEQVLEDFILSSKLIDRNILARVKSVYLDNPYHNYLHALKIASYILYLDKGLMNITEIRSLLFAALFHDAGHTIKTEILDEFISLDIALQSIQSLMSEANIIGIDTSIVRQAIMGTVFSQRAKISNKYAKILSDCDIGVIGEDLANYCYYSISLHLEFQQDFHVFITTTQKGYMRYLLGINPQIFISQEIAHILPNSHRTITDFCRLDMQSKVEMYETLKDQDITLQEFKEKFSLQ